ncbi:MAG: cytochrome c biogenesis protein CcsA [Acidobacteria bacterium]|nr:cytochrome c biogenesis protein CcsA [Acidobacteriota bacterium]
MKELLVLALAFYLVALIQAGLVFFQKPRLPFAITLVSSLSGFLLHTAALIIRGKQVERCPIALQPELLLFLGWSLAAYCLTAFIWNREQILANYVFPLAFLSTLIGVILPLPPVSPLGLRVGGTVLFPIHVTMVLFAYTAFFVTFVTGLIYLFQERQLKLKKFKAILGRFPALDTCDSISYRSMSIGFILLTVGIVTGIIWSGQRYGVYWHGDPIEIATMLTWVNYMFMIHYRVAAGWRGRRAAIVSIVGFAFIIISLAGLKYLGRVHVFVG